MSRLLSFLRQSYNAMAKLKKYAKGNRKFFSHDKDVVNFEAACCGQGVLEFSYLCTKVAERLPDWWESLVNLKAPRSRRRKER